VTLASRWFGQAQAPTSSTADTLETRLGAGDARRRAANESARLLPIPPVLGVRKGDKRCFPQLRTVADRQACSDMVRSQGSVGAVWRDAGTAGEGRFGISAASSVASGRRQTACELLTALKKCGPSCTGP
jgi:hypothetical protein